MLGDFITRLLVLLLGYAYPAFECYKTVENNKVQNEELRFWCQYWIIVACVAVFERFGDIFFSWFPVYGEMKLTFFVYLWYPKTKGTSRVYQMVLQPFLSRYETDIERMVVKWRSRAWNFAIYYWKNCTELGQSTFLKILKYFANPSAKKDALYSPRGPQPTRKKQSFSFFRSKKSSNTPPSTPNNDFKRNIFQRSLSDLLQLQPDSQDRARLRVKRSK